MAVSLHHLVVDARDLPGLARFWCRVLDWQVLSEKPREVVIGPDESAATGICFMPVSEPKTVKNRLHFDLAPDDQDAEVERILALGARRVDIGQGSGAGWVVLADPEGNEFCVLRPKASLIAFRDA
ncbi:VOC family protein [Streptomyces sp. NPDC101225]|uniref:VOC family protein n=1 Tax=Streptomyces sp. NPDC101225 TaxID=3366135 RepID=UPI003806DBF0